jgi:hypothetical protein
MLKAHAIRAIIAFAFTCGANGSCHAQKAMMFNSVDQYVEHASGIWIVEDIQKIGQEVDQIRVVQTLKGETKGPTMLVTVIFRRLILGDRYLLFGFSVQPSDLNPKGIWMDNGDISPVPIPAMFSISQLQGKPINQQIEMILLARSAEIDNQTKKLTVEKKAIENGLELQKRQEQVLSPKI